MVSLKIYIEAITTNLTNEANSCRTIIILRNIVEEEAARGQTDRARINRMHDRLKTFGQEKIYMKGKEQRVGEGRDD